MIYKISGIK